MGLAPLWPTPSKVAAGMLIAAAEAVANQVDVELAADDRPEPEVVHRAQAGRSGGDGTAAPRAAAPRSVAGYEK
jgi:hypothetical protein